MKHTDTNEMTRGYLIAALWTSDDNAPGGCDYEACGRADEMLEKIDSRSLAKAQSDCEAFELSNSTDLELANLPQSEIGHSFWLSRNGHGSGFFDRKTHNDPQEEQDACDRLQDAARLFGMADCTFETVIYID